MRCGYCVDQLRRQDLHVAREHDQVGPHVARAARAGRPRAPPCRSTGATRTGCRRARRAGAARRGWRARRRGRRRSARRRGRRAAAARQCGSLVTSIADALRARARRGGARVTSMWISSPIRFRPRISSSSDDREVGEVDQHRHDEETLHDALLDVLDVGVAAGEVGGDAGDDALLVAPDDRDDREVFASCHRVSLRVPQKPSEFNALT